MNKYNIKSLYAINPYKGKHLFVEGGDTTDPTAKSPDVGAMAAQAAAMGLEMYGNITNGAKQVEKKAEAIEQAREGYNIESQSNSLDALEDEMLNARRLKQIEGDDLYEGQDVLKATVSGAASGAALGSMASPGLGTAIGVVGGALAGAGSALFGNAREKKKAQEEAEALNSQGEDKFSLYQDNLAAKAMNISDRNTRAAAAQIAAYGGQLNGYGGNWTNGLTFINNGSTHEGNPYGGVPIGTAPDGQPNLVEEGEIIWNDYVFSNRLTVPDDIRAKYKLGRKKDLTYADAVEKLQKASKERPNDEIEKRGLDSALNELAQSQEGVRQAKQQQEAFNQQEALASMFADGGDIHINKNKRGTFTAAATKHKMGVQEFASHVLSNKDRFSPEMVKKANFARNASHWAHAYGGGLFAHGGTLGYMFDGTGRVPNYIVLTDEKPLPTERAWTYNINKPIIDDSIPAGMNNYGEILGYQTGNNVYAPTVTTANTIPHADERPGTKTETETETTGGGKGFKWDESYLRYAPIVGSAINTAVSLFDKPNYKYADAIDNAVGNQKVDNVSFNPIGDYLAYRPLDRLFYANELSAQNAANSRNIINLSNGNRAAAMAGLLAQNYNTNTGLGKLYRQGEEYNQEQRQKVAEFNRGTNIFNSEQGLKAQMANADLRDKYNARVYDAAVRSNTLRQAEDNQIQANRSAALTGLFDNIGNVGWEAFNRNMINSDMSKYYSIDNTGKVNYKKAYWDLSKEEQAKIDDEIKSRNKPQSKRSSYTIV